MCVVMQPIVLLPIAQGQLHGLARNSTPKWEALLTRRGIDRESDRFYR